MLKIFDFDLLYLGTIFFHVMSQFRYQNMSYFEELKVLKIEIPKITLTHMRVNDFDKISKEFP